MMRKMQRKPFAIASLVRTHWLRVAVSLVCVSNIFQGRCTMRNRHNFGSLRICIQHTLPSFPYLEKFILAMVGRLHGGETNEYAEHPAIPSIWIYRICVTWVSELNGQMCYYYYYCIYQRSEGNGLQNYNPVWIERMDGLGLRNPGYSISCIEMLSQLYRKTIEMKWCQMCCCCSVEHVRRATAFMIIWITSD